MDGVPLSQTDIGNWAHVVGDIQAEDYCYQDLCDCVV